MITGDECGPNVQTFVLRLRKIPGKLDQEIDPTGDRTLVHCVRGNDVTLDQSGGIPSREATMLQRWFSIYGYRFSSNK